MEAKEKAIELVDKFKFKESTVYTCSHHFANQCALICVEEIINEYDVKICGSGYDNDFEMWDNQKKYWQQVKTELENL